MSEPRWNGLTETLGGRSIFSVGYRLHVSEQAIDIEFLVSKWPLSLQPARPGEFYEGLWLGDCGELWIYAPSTGRYIELNLAPNGAWWACVFSSPRVRDLDCDPPKCQTKGHESPQNGWMSSLRISMAEVSRCLHSTESLRGNVTVIVDGCPDVDPPLDQLHTAVTLGAADFHRPQDWTPLIDLVSPKLSLEENDDE